MPKMHLPTIDELSDTCTSCAQRVTPSQIMRLDMYDNCRCPHCGAVYNLRPDKPVQSAPHQ